MDICTAQIGLCMVFLKSNHEVGGDRDVKRGEGGVGGDEYEQST